MQNQKQNNHNQRRVDLLSLAAPHLISIIIILAATYLSSSLVVSEDTNSTSTGSNNDSASSHSSGTYQESLDCTSHETCYSSFHQDLAHDTASGGNNIQPGITWRWKYVNEQSKQFPFMDRPEQTVDERLANIQHAVSSIPMSLSDFYQFDVNSETDKKLELLASRTKNNEVDDELCWKELNSMLALINELQVIVKEKRFSNLTAGRQIEEKHLRLAHVLDSFGKYGAGLMAGRTLFLGSHGQCEESQLIDLPGLPVKRVDMRYCMVRLKADQQHLHPDLQRIPKSSNEPDDSIMTAICIPKSCHSKSFHRNKGIFKQLVDSQFKLPDSIYVDANLELHSVYCLIDKDSPLVKIPISGYLLILILVVWFSLIAYATLLYTDHQPVALNKWKRHIINSLNFQTSWLDFISSQNVSRKISSSDRVNLDTLNPLKVIGCVFVVYGHSMMVVIAACVNKLKAFNELENDPLAMGATSLTLVVDSFFVISGMLIAFIAMKKIKRPEPKDSLMRWFAKESLKIAGSRFLRLVPLYFLVFWFKKSILTYLGHGPSWDYGFNMKTPIGSCRAESWLTPFTTQAAFIPLSKQCLPQAWSVALDIFYAITLAPLLVLLSIKPKVATLIALILSLISCTAMRTALAQIEPTLKADLANFRMHAFSQMFGYLTLLYSSPFYRAFSMLIGILAGYALYHYEQNKILKVWPNWFKGIATKLASFIMLLTFITPAFIPNARNEFLVNYPIPEGLFEHLMSTSRLIWALASSVLFLRMVTDWKENYIMQNSAGNFWKTMVRLNYPILLIHFDVLLLDSMSRTTTIFYSRYQVINMFTSGYLICSIIASILHIFIENPIDKLVKSIWTASLNSEKNAQKSKET